VTEHGADIFVGVFCWCPVLTFLLQIFVGILVTGYGVNSCWEFGVEFLLGIWGGILVTRYDVEIWGGILVGNFCWKFGVEFLLGIFVGNFCWEFLLGIWGGVNWMHCAVYSTNSSAHFNSIYFVAYTRQ